ncbi:unnamed protein product [Heligmosomoides polygyrus]|uniref:Peroxisomal membrane protein 4 n=1 Tax=Heligmosomoides polygyrus TaxID=6339 RepID=A0A3P8BN73_HELPZ|nr:unnamed protein product [Heligmosomoides polygyrus]
MIATVMHLIRHWESLGNEFLKAFKDQHHILSALKGLRNGVVYGARIRAPHALVMVFLFGEGTLAEKLQTILRLTKTHAVNLAKFVFSYKLCQGILQRLEDFPVFPLFAAAVWGIVLWLFEHHTNVLQGSLVKSMTYLYKDSNYWTDIRNFLLRNK